MAPVRNMLYGAGAIGGGVSLFGLVKLVANFEKDMSRVKALTNATAKEFDALKAKAREMGKETVFTSSDAAQAMQHFAKAGLSVDEIMTSMRPTLDLAAAANLSIADSAQITIKLLRGMGIEAGELSRTADVLAKAFTTSNTDLTQLGEAFKYVGPVAQTMKRPLEEVTAAIQLMSDAGLQGSMAGTSLRNIFLRLSGEGGAAEVFQRIGLQVTDTAGRFKPLADIIDDLNEKLSKLSEADKTAALMKAFGLRGGPGAAVMLEEGGDKLRQKMKILAESDGTASRIATTQVDNLSGAYSELTSRLEEAGLAIGDKFLPELREATERASILTDTIRNGGQVMKDRIVTITKYGLALSLLVRYGGSAVSVIRSIGLAISAATGPIGLLTTAVATLTAAFIASDESVQTWIADLLGITRFEELRKGTKAAEAGAKGADNLVLAEESKQRAEEAQKKYDKVVDDEKKGLDLTGKPIKDARQRADIAREKSNLLTEVKRQRDTQIRAAQEAEKEFSEKDRINGINGFFGSVPTENARKLINEGKSARNRTVNGFTIDQRIKDLDEMQSGFKQESATNEANRRNHLFGLAGKLGLNFGLADDIKKRADAEGKKPRMGELAEALPFGNFIKNINAMISQGPIGQAQTAIKNALHFTNEAMKPPEESQARFSTAGIDDFSRSLQESLMAGPAKQTAQNTKKVADNTKEMKEKQDKQVEALSNFMKKLGLGIPAVAS